jgi:hypothetical protein
MTKEPRSRSSRDKKACWTCSGDRAPTTASCATDDDGNAAGCEMSDVSSRERACVPCAPLESLAASAALMPLTEAETAAAAAGEPGSAAVPPLSPPTACPLERAWPRMGRGLGGGNERCGDRSEHAPVGDPLAALVLERHDRPRPYTGMMQSSEMGTLQSGHSAPESARAFIHRYRQPQQ